jgi:hypothetical protein
MHARRLHKFVTEAPHRPRAEIGTQRGYRTQLFVPRFEGFGATTRMTEARNDPAIQWSECFGSHVPNPSSCDPTSRSVAFIGTVRLALWPRKGVGVLRGCRR